MIETEDKCLTSLLGQQQSVIRRAIEKQDLQTISGEHDRLLGTDSEPGQLPLKFKFTYAAEDNDDERTSPIPLPEPPIIQPPSTEG